MQWDKVKLFGFRVTVEKVEERVGRIVVPENRQVLYQIGRVVCVGDCMQPDGTKEESLVALGDLVYFQTNAMMAAYQQYERDGMIEDEVAEAMAELRAGILSSMVDRAYDRAELDLQSWRRRGDFP